MFRREKRRRMRRLLAAALAGAVVIVPAAPATIVHDAPSDRAAQPSVIPYVSQGQAAIPGLTGDAAESAFVRADGPDGAVAREPVLRRDASATTGPYTTAAPVSDGSGFDWSASGLGAVTAAFLMVLGYAGFRAASRGRIAGV